MAIQRLTAAVRAAARGIAVELGARARFHEAERALAALPDSILKDMGLARGEIRRRARGA